MRASLSQADAEDVASLTFEAILTNRLLARWMLNQSAKLRTLLCSVVRNVISNRARVNQGRERILQELAESGLPDGIIKDESAAAEQLDMFYAAWVAEVLQQVVESLLNKLHQEDKGDYFRVLYSRICEEMTMPEIAAALSIPLTSAENYYKAARKQLSQQLENHVKRHVARYCSEPDVPEEFLAEWTRLGEYLASHGGLEEVLRPLSHRPPDFERPPAQNNANYFDSLANSFGLVAIEHEIIWPRPSSAADLIFSLHQAGEEVIFGLAASLIPRGNSMFFILPVQLRDNAPRHAVPLANGFLVVANVLFFCFGWTHSWAVGPGTSLLTIVAYGFAHVGVLHLVGNMWTLLVFGNPLNRRLGNGYYLLLYFGTILFLGLFARLFCTGYLMGASGGVFAVIVACALLMPANIVDLGYFALFPITLLVGLFYRPKHWGVLVHTVGLVRDACFLVARSCAAT